MTNLSRRFVKNGRALCGESAASTPTNVVRIRIGASIFAGAYRRADRVVRPYGCVSFRIGAINFAAVYRAGGACPSPTLRRITENLKNRKNEARKAVAFRASAGEGGGRVLMMPARPPPGEICRAPLRQSAADANAAGHTAASADRAWLLRRTLLHAPAGTSALLCMEIGIPVLESSESLWHQYARRARRHTRKNSPFSCD